jgi:hypothetical protein
MVIIPTITGWWYTYSSEKYDLVSWDDELPIMMGNIIHTCSKPPTSLANQWNNIF